MPTTSNWPTLADMMIRTMSNPEFESQLRQAYLTSNSAWWVSQEGFHFVPDTNAQTANVDDGRRFWAVGQDYTPEMARQDSQWMFTRPPSPYRGLLESAYADIEPEDL